MEELKKYLESMNGFYANVIKTKDRQYSSMYDFVLKNGVECKPQVFPYQKFECAPRTKRECFRNAWILAEWFDLIYVEGYANSIIPVIHAWCVDEELNVYDPTWDDPEKASYFGVLFSNRYVGNTIFERCKYGVLDNFEMRYPLLTGIHNDFKYKFKTK